MTALKLIVGTANIDKAIASIANRGKKLDGDIQLAAVSILDHVEQHGDVTLADRLLAAMPKGARKLALVEFLLAFGKLRVLDKANKDDAVRIAAGATFAHDKTKQTNIEGASEKPWYEFKQEKAAIEAFDVQAAVAQLLTRVSKLQADGTVKIEHADLVEKLAALVKA